MRSYNPADDNLTFEEESHTYSKGGVVLPSVTQILSRAGYGPPPGMDRSFLNGRALVGTLVHQCAHYDDEGDFDPACLDAYPDQREEVLDKLEGWRQFVHEVQPKFVDIELVVWGKSVTKSYAGAIDRVMENQDGLHLLDIKTGKAPDRTKIKEYEGLQLAGYSWAYEQRTGMAIESCATVHVGIGRYVVCKYDEDSWRTRWLELVETHA